MLYYQTNTFLNSSLLFFLHTEPYTVRQARIHVRHVRDLLKSEDPSDAYNGVDCQSLSFLTSILNDGKYIPIPLFLISQNVKEPFMQGQIQCFL